MKYNLNSMTVIYDDGRTRAMQPSDAHAIWLKTPAAEQTAAKAKQIMVACCGAQADGMDEAQCLEILSY